VIHSQYTELLSSSLLYIYLHTVILFKHKVDKIAEETESNMLNYTMPPFSDSLARYRTIIIIIIIYLHTNVLID